MFILTIYILVVWWQVSRHRRHWLGFAIAFAGAVMVLPVADPLVYLIWWALDEQPIWIYPFLYAYAALIFTIGAYIACLPYPPETHRPCHACQYDLAGNTTGTCPECGTPIRKPTSPTARHRSSTPSQAPPQQPPQH